LNKKKLLILIEWFTPGYKAGGPIQSSVNLANALKNSYEVTVITTDTDHNENLPYENINSEEWNERIVPGIRVLYMRRADFSKRKLKHYIQEIAPDFIYLSLMFSPSFVIYPLWLHHKRVITGKIVLCPRGTLYKSGLKIKSYKKLPYLWLFRVLGFYKGILFHATNEREKAAILKYFPKAEVKIANNLPQTVQTPLQLCRKDPGLLKCVFIARIVPIKNLGFLLNALEQCNSRIVLNIVGPKEDEGYWKECAGHITTMPPNIEVNYIGSLPPQQLPEVLNQNHLMVLPTTGENFGHSIFESLLSGRPVLISDQTPWLDLELKKIGWDISLGDMDKFVAALNEAACWDQETFEQYANNAWNFAHRFISNPELINEYKELFS